MFKVKTIEQFYVFEFIKENFDIQFIKLDLVDYYTIRLTDNNNDTALFYYNEEFDTVMFERENEFISM